MHSSLNIDDLLDELAEKVAVRLRPELAQIGVAAPAVSQRLLTVPQAATYLGRTEYSIRHMTADGTLPVVKHDTRVFLDRRDLDEWIADGKM